MGIQQPKEMTGQRLVSWSEKRIMLK
jgi:hypothetical protein